MEGVGDGQFSGTKFFSYVKVTVLEFFRGGQL